MAATKHFRTYYLRTFPPAKIFRKPVASADSSAEDEMFSSLFFFWFVSTATDRVALYLQNVLRCL